jgi:hypothetical protein
LEGDEMHWLKLIMEGIILALAVIGAKAVIDLVCEVIHAIKRVS